MAKRIRILVTALLAFTLTSPALFAAEGAEHQNDLPAPGENQDSFNAHHASPETQRQEEEAATQVSAEAARRYYYPFDLGRVKAGEPISRGLDLEHKVDPSQKKSPLRTQSVYTRFNRAADGGKGRWEWVITDDFGKVLGALPENYVVSGDALGLSGAAASKRFQLKRVKNPSIDNPWLEVKSSTRLGSNGNPWRLLHWDPRFNRYAFYLSMPFPNARETDPQNYIVHGHKGGPARIVRVQITRADGTKGTYWGLTNAGGYLTSQVLGYGAVVGAENLGVAGNARFRVTGDPSFPFEEVPPNTPLTLGKTDPHLIAFARIKNRVVVNTGPPGNCRH